jgi:hypothetical protein
VKRDFFARPPSPAIRGVLVLSLLAVVEAVLLGGHLLHAGLYTDDWSIAAIRHESGAVGLFNGLFASNRERPLGELYLAATSAVSGSDPHLHALCGLLTLLAATASVYLLLRRLSLSTRDAVSIVLLFMVFPFADASWLWYAASYSYLAIALAALGGVAALEGLRTKGASALVYRVGALLLFAASVVTYQVAAGVICLSVLVYLPRTGRRRAVAFWLLDVCAVALAASLPRLMTGSAGLIADKVVTLSEQIEHAKLMADQSLTLLTAALVPFRGPHRNVVLPIALAVVCVGVLLAWRVRAEPELRRRLRLLLLLCAAGGVVIVAAYAVYVPAPINLYQPLGKGEENRVNVMASLGYAIVVYAVVMLFATSVVRLLRRPLKWAPAIGLAIAVVVFVGYVSRTRRDIAAWDRAGTIQHQELAELRTAGRPLPSTTIYTFGGIGATAPGVYAFRVTWDLSGAVQLLWNDATLHAYPIFLGTTVMCTATQVVPIGPGNGDGIGQAANYRHAVFYDFHNAREERITNAATCTRAVADFAAGAVES